jgi:hypothetical protein
LRRIILARFFGRNRTASGKISAAVIRMGCPVSARKDGMRLSRRLNRLALQRFATPPPPSCLSGTPADPNRRGGNRARRPTHSRTNAAGASIPLVAATSRPDASSASHSDPYQLGRERLCEVPCASSSSHIRLIFTGLAEHRPLTPTGIGNRSCL